MMSSVNTSPDTLEITLGELDVAEFPGDCAWDALRVHFAEDVHAAILTHAHESDKLELCGVLVGLVLKDDRGPFVSITHSIRGEHAEHHAAQVTFTQDTWAHIHRVMDAAHSGRSIVGWYHTHPGFGIFLSEMDIFIHRHFFDLPWQVAFVVDPIAKDEGLFVWRMGDPARTRVFWVGDEERCCAPDAASGSERSMDSRISELESRMMRLRRSIARQRVMLFFLFVLVLALSGWVSAGFIWRAECEQLTQRAWDWLRHFFPQQ